MTQQPAPETKIAIREELTDQWKKHGVQENREYEILRDHMTDLELIFSMLDEASTTQVTKAEHPEGFVANKAVAQRGGGVAGIARKKLEQETGQKVVSKINYFQVPQKKLKIQVH